MKTGRAIPFDIVRARAALEMACRAYDEATIESDLAHALLRYEGDSRRLTIAFRGTQNVRDWLTDFDCPQVEVPGKKGMMVHRGFLSALASILPEVIEAVKGYNVCELVIAGHSLGGALAALAAPALQGAGLWPSAIFTFGQPRVGNWFFAQQFDLYFRQIAWRFVNEDDIVPRVPFVGMGYRHAGRCCFFPNETPNTNLQAPGKLQASNTKVVIDPPLWRLLRSDAIGIFTDYEDLEISTLEDHGREQYVARLAGLAVAEPMEVAS